ncbi:MAG: nitroreductase family protein [Dehalococcoidia bacterium]|nr:nitroreductase family protein [Dehalococcoidia bacterium]
MSETYDTIVSKRDTRRFSDRPIPPDTLARLVQAARMAGSAKAAQPVRLVLVSDQAQKERLAACGNATPHPHLPGCGSLRSRPGSWRDWCTVRDLPRTLRCRPRSPEPDARRLGRRDRQLPGVHASR